MLNPPELAQRPSLRRRFLSLPTAVSFAAAAALLVLLLTRFEVDWVRTVEVVRESNPWWLVLAAAVHYTTFLFRGARWRLLMANATRGEDPPQPLPPTLYYGAIILIGWFANSVTWFRLGDAYRAYAYADDTRTNFSQAMGTVVADRVVDIGVVLTLMAGGVAALYWSGNARPSPVFLAAGAVLFAMVLAGLLVMYLVRDWAGPRLPRRLAGAYERFHAGTMGSFRRLHLVVLLGVLSWLAEVGRLFFVLKALGVELATALVFFVPMANGLLTAVPLTPGGLGIVEPGVTGLLLLELVREEAVAIALLDRSISYVSIVATGGTAFLIRHVLVARRTTRGAQPGRGRESSSDWNP